MANKVKGSTRKTAKERIHLRLSPKDSEVPKGEVRFAIRDIDPKDHSFSGVASVFNNTIDSWMPTRILPGAFTKTIREGLESRKIKILWQHWRDALIGRPLKLEERPEGLYIEGHISKTDLGKDALELMRDGTMTDMSIGFDAITEQIVEEEISEGGVKVTVKIREISELRLWEISLVTWGADDKAKITEVNAAEDLANSLRGVQPDVMAKALKIITTELTTELDKKIMDEEPLEPKAVEGAELDDAISNGIEFKVSSDGLLEQAMDAYLKDHGPTSAQGKLVLGLRVQMKTLLETAEPSEDERVAQDKSRASSAASLTALRQKHRELDLDFHTEE